MRCYGQVRVGGDVAPPKRYYNERISSDFEGDVNAKKYLCEIMTDCYDRKFNEKAHIS
jgi:hypothetical protein